MSVSKFQKILEFLNFGYNLKCDANDSARNKAYKIKDVVQFIIDHFNAVSIAIECISINEGLLLCKGRLFFK